MSFEHLRPRHRTRAAAAGEGSFAHLLGGTPQRSANGESQPEGTSPILAAGKPPRGETQGTAPGPFADLRAFAIDRLATSRSRH
jgi:hypothetical protein